MICDDCGKGWQDAAGRVIAIDPIDVERAECDAQRVGSATKPERATHDITPMVRRHVWRRDHGKCCVPACRASRNIDIHHIVHRADGGDHESANLVLLCGGHHRALHDAKLEIRGTASRIISNYVTAPTLAVSATPHVGQNLRGTRTQPPVPIAAVPVGPSKFATVVMVTQAKQALTQLGFQRAESARYVDAALAMMTDAPDLPSLIRAALQRSRRIAPNGDERNWLLTQGSTFWIDARTRKSSARGGYASTSIGKARDCSRIAGRSRFGHPPDPARCRRSR